MFGDHFYHATMRKSVAVFGTLFNNLKVIRKASGGGVLNQVRVPLAYGPKQKFLARLDAEVGRDNPIAIKLPRMAFEITSLSLDPYAKYLRERNLRKLMGSAFSEVVCLDTGEDKDRILKEYQDSGYLWIEDKVQNAECGLKYGLDSVLFEHGFNMDNEQFKKYPTWESIYEKRSPMNGKVRSWNTTRSIWIRRYRLTKSTSSPNNLKRKTMRTVVRTRQSARIATKTSVRRGSLVSRQRRQEPRLRTSANTTRHRLSGLWTLMGSLWSSTLTRSYRRSLIKKRVWNSLISCRGQYLRSTGSRGLAL